VSQISGEHTPKQCNLDRLKSGLKRDTNEKPTGVLKQKGFSGVARVNKVIPSLGYQQSVLNKNTTLKTKNSKKGGEEDDPPVHIICVFYQQFTTLLVLLNHICLFCSIKFLGSW